MTKLPKAYQFIDLSDYGRPAARLIARLLKHSPVTPVHLTKCFFIAGLTALYFMLAGQYIPAALFLVLKSILDAADGELARVKATPSYTGRYLDSIADIILNFLIFICLWIITGQSAVLAIMAFAAVQLQGTLYNYYYVIQRISLRGDRTSRIFENHVPDAMPGEKQITVTILYHCYNIMYILFDKCIYYLDNNAVESAPFPKWFMSCLSTLGLGFQLLLISIFLLAGWISCIIPFFLVFTFSIPLFILIRKVFL